jgi:8-oxo-dGTP pyrophosphatase MutT (NUDIX family)
MTLIVLVVVPHEGRYLVVEELDGTFFLPAGKVEPGENLIAAAVRETAEEAGVLIGLRGLLGFDHEWSESRVRLRFVFVGYLGLNTPPKRRPDAHSRGAAWVTKDELTRMPLRHREVLHWIERYEAATALLPCAAYEPIGTASPAPWSARLG